ncbi:hypothetical protein Sjap_008930 [Stephania japonica]|uniref:Uncharacterized protein n=1 Tax=Stephania japonica TaxID=461633 RepID=A0AAP0JQH4_9MAGN
MKVNREDREERQNEGEGDLGSSRRSCGRATEIRETVHIEPKRERIEIRIRGECRHGIILGISNMRDFMQIMSTVRVTEVEHSSIMSPKVEQRIESMEAELCKVQVVVETISRLTLKVDKFRFEISEFRSEIRRLTQKMETDFSHTRVMGSVGGADPHIRAPGSQIVNTSRPIK